STETTKVRPRYCVNMCSPPERVGQSESHDRRETNGGSRPAPFTRKDNESGHAGEPGDTGHPTTHLHLRHHGRTSVSTRSAWSRLASAPRARPSFGSACTFRSRSFSAPGGSQLMGCSRPWPTVSAFRLTADFAVGPVTSSAMWTAGGFLR